MAVSHGACLACKQRPQADARPIRWKDNAESIPGRAEPCLRLSPRPRDGLAASSGSGTADRLARVRFPALAGRRPDYAVTNAGRPALTHRLMAPMPDYRN